MHQRASYDLTDKIYSDNSHSQELFLNGLETNSHLSNMQNLFEVIVQRLKSTNLHVSIKDLKDEIKRDISRR